MHRQTSAIRDIIIPFDRYPHLNENQTMQDAIKLFLSFPTTDDMCFSKLLVVNDDHQLIGWLDRIDIMQGLAPRLMDVAKTDKFEGKDTEYPNLAFLYEDSTFAECGENQTKPIKSLMQPIEFSLTADTPILKAIVMMTHRNNFNVPVTDNGAIIGVLRLENIFKAMCTSYCEIK